MTDYIINPALFYWVEVASCINLVAAIALTISLIAGSVIIFVTHDCYDEEDDEFKKGMKLGKKFLCVAAVCTLIIIFVPNKETLLKMQLARLATGDNVEMVLQRITEAAKEIIGGTK